MASQLHRLRLQLSGSWTKNSLTDMYISSHSPLVVAYNLTDSIHFKEETFVFVIQSNMKL